MIKIKFKEYVPIIDKICIIGIYSVNENTIKFQGNPLKIKPLIYSIDPKIIEKINIEEIFLLNLKREQVKVANP